MLSRGFTLIELVTVVAIVAVLLVAGVPMIGDAIQTARIRSAAGELAASLQAARAVALRSNNSATYQLESTGSWTVTLPDGTQAKSGRLDFVDKVSVNPATASFSFNSLGGVAFRAFDLGPTAMDRCRTVGGDIDCLRVELLAGGAARICNPYLTAGSSENACTP